MIKVLIVEDEEVARKGLVQTLDWKEMGCTVIGEAANGKIGIDLVKELEPDLIITDVRMPQVDGISMIHQLRREGCRAHVIMLSAHSDFAYAQSAMREGVADYLLKPLRVEELKATILRVFSKDDGQSMQTGREAEHLPEVLKPEMLEKIENKYINRAVSYIGRHFGDDISVKTLADYLQISEGYLSRVLKKETGYTLTNYVMYYRIAMACELLKDCRMKVYEAAERVGYSDTAYFSTLFKKIMGMSPTEYQENVPNQKAERNRQMLRNAD